jgi:penicillin-binding protein 1A
VAEMVRRQIYSEFKEQTYELGLTVFTTIRAKEQIAAQKALENAVFKYTLSSQLVGSSEVLKLSRQTVLREKEIKDYLSTQKSFRNIFPSVIHKN